MSDFRGIREKYNDISIVGSRSAGLMTEFKTEAGKPIYISETGEIVSEKSRTLRFNGKWVNVPSIHDGIEYSEDQLLEMLEDNKIKPTSTHKSLNLAEKAAQKRSPSLMSEETIRNIEKKYSSEMTKRKATASEMTEEPTALKTPDAKAEEQMDNLMKIQDDPYLLVENDKEQKIEKYMSTLSEQDKEGIKTYLEKPTAKINSVEDEGQMSNFPKESGTEVDDQTITAFSEGGLKDEGGTVDPVSGNDVPAGSTQKEVRDDIPAQLSEGEFVLPADVVRYIGLENLMELRNKAKQGLQQMEAMGQMGNSEEATMDDTADMDVDIDALIDEFDPNAPETMNFAEGGMPTYQYQSPQNIYNPTTNYNPYTGMTGQPQQFTTGYMPQTTYQAPPVYGANAGRFTSGQPMGGGAVEQRQYVGPNGELRTFTFIDGKPTEEIPAGFKVYKPEEKAEPQIVKPEIAPVSQDGGDNGQDQQARDEYAGYVSEMSQLAQLDKTVGDLWSESLHNPNNTKGFKDTLGNFIKAGGIVGAVKSDYAMHQAVQAAAPNIASAYGLDINNYKNTGLSSIFSKYNTDALARDAITSKAVAESLGMDPRDLARTNIDSDGDGRISEDEAKKAEADLFMDEDGVDYAKEIAKEEAERKARQDALVEQANREAAEAAQRAANKAEAERNAAKVRDSGGDGNGGGGGGGGGGGPSDSFGGGRDSDGWGE